VTLANTQIGAQTTTTPRIDLPSESDKTNQRSRRERHIDTTTYVNDVFKHLNATGAVTDNDGNIYFDVPDNFDAIRAELSSHVGQKTTQELMDAHDKETEMHKSLVAFAQARTYPRLANLPLIFEQVFLEFEKCGLNFGAFSATVQFLYNAMVGKGLALEDTTQLPSGALDILKQMGLLAATTPVAGACHTTTFAINSLIITPLLRSALMALSQGHDPTVVKVPPEVFYPQPSLVDATGRFKSKRQYRADLKEMHDGRAKVAKAQAQHGIGTAPYHLASVPSYTVGHGLRGAGTQLAAIEKHPLGATAGTLLSAGTSALAGSITGVVNTVNLLGATFTVNHGDQSVKLPLFLPGNDLRSIQRQPKSTLETINEQFTWNNLYPGVEPKDKLKTLAWQTAFTTLVLGPTAYLQPVINKLTALAWGGRDSGTGRQVAGILTQACGVAVVFFLVNLVFFRGLKSVAGKFLPDKEKQHQDNMEHQMLAAMQEFIRTHPEFEASVRAQNGQLTPAQLSELFDHVDLAVRRTLEQAIDQQEYDHISPYHGQQMLDSYEEHAGQLRDDIAAAAASAAVPPEMRTSAMKSAINTLTERLQMCSLQVQQLMAPLNQRVAAANAPMNELFRVAVEGN